MKRLGMLAGAVLWSIGSAQAGHIDPGLQEVLDLAGPGEVISTLVYLQEQADTFEITRQMDAQRARLRTRHEVVIGALKDTAAASQGDAVAAMAAMKADGRIGDYRAFWLANVIRVDAVPARIIQIAQRPDVDQVFFNAAIGLIEPVAQGPIEGPQPVGVVEQGVSVINAPAAWDLGITGQGVLVATLDTGVDGSHPALASRWRGLDPAYAGHPEWAFFDPVTGWTFPQDSGSHGTHTMGTTCGGFPGDQVGVAPGAEWIHAAVIDRVNIATTVADAISAFQWMVDPDGNPGTSFDVPTTCSNSWGLTTAHGYPNCDDTFWSFIDNCEAAGIVVLFAAGNEGTGGVRRPADRATDDYRNLAVAAIDGADPNFLIAPFSSRGPTFCTPGGTEAVKPDISAPGVEVRSSVPGGGYSTSNGTSMATPHVNGVVALMRQANPDLPVAQIKQIIYDTAFDLPPGAGDGEDNDYGWGLIDALAAVEQALATVSLTFSFPDGQPEFIDPNGGTTIHVVVSGQATTPESGTGKLYYSTGQGYTEVPMVESTPNEYDAVFPAFGCGDAVSYYFSAESDMGDTAYSPFTAPEASYSADAYSGISFAFRDTFESDLGWTVSDSGGLLTGTWERGVPAGGGDRGDPSVDADGSGQCYVTGNQDGDDDVDDGATTLTSPDMDASDPDAVLAYWQWYHNTFGGDPANDIFVAEVSDDGGGSWVQLQVTGPSGPEVSGGWIHKEFLVADIPGVSSSAQFRVRFTASDLGAGSVIEAGIDGVMISTLFCDGLPCTADIDGDGQVGVVDLLGLLGAWGSIGGPADILDPPGVGVEDLLELLAQWGSCS